MQKEMNSLLATALGIEEMSPEQRDAFLEKTGSIIIDAAVGRLLLSMTEEEIAQLETSLGADVAPEDMFTYLLETYPNFEKIINEETIAFREEAEKVVT